MPQSLLHHILRWIHSIVSYFAIIIWSSPEVSWYANTSLHLSDIKSKKSTVVTISNIEMTIGEISHELWYQYSIKECQVQERIVSTFKENWWKKVLFLFLCKKLVIYIKLTNTVLFFNCVMILFIDRLYPCCSTSVIVCKLFHLLKL